MKNPKSLQLGWIAGSLALALAFVSAPTTARANVYATDIQINSVLSGPYSVGVGGSLTLTYHLNDNATAGVTINILNGAAVVSSTHIAYPSAAGAGTSLGLNTVSLTAPATAGTYSISITAAATGYSTWQQYTALDANHTEVYPHGMAVDNNPTSPYYGRVVVGCNVAATTTTSATTYQTAHSVPQLVGLYKYNADGTLPDAPEQSFGFAQYTTDDAGVTTASQSGGVNQMADGKVLASTQNSLSDPYTIRIGEDDRIYFDDDCGYGSVQSCDIQAVGPVTHVFNTANFVNCPDSYPTDAQFHVGNTAGWRTFDIINTATPSSYSGTGGVYTGGQAAIFVSESGAGDFPSPGTWMWHLVDSANGKIADPTDTYGQQAVFASTGSALSLRTDGIAVDYNLDLFATEFRGAGTDPANRTACWANWNGGVLPLGDQGGINGGGEFYAASTGALWVEGSADATDVDTTDIAINSRTHPTLVATAHSAGTDGIRLLNALNASYTITGITLSGSSLTINCSCSPYLPTISPAALSLVSSSAVSGSPYSTPVTATFTAGSVNNTFATTIPIPGATTYYQVGGPATGGGTLAVGSATTILAAGPVVASTLANIDAGHFYFSAVAFDNVGNLYGATTSDNYWRAWSPPGPNSATTVAVATVSAH